jgi:hypothetical protein
MRGLPFDCNETDIRSFFGPNSGIMEDGIMLLHRPEPDRRPVRFYFLALIWEKMWSDLSYD